MPPCEGSYPKFVEFIFKHVAISLGEKKKPYDPDTIKIMGYLTEIKSREDENTMSGRIILTY